MVLGSHPPGWISGQMSVAIHPSASGRSLPLVASATGDESRIRSMKNQHILFFGVGGQDFFGETYF